MNKPISEIPIDPELVLIEELAQKVVELTWLKQTIFETNFRWEYHHNNPAATEHMIRFSSHQATRDHEQASFMEAVCEVVTKEVKGEAMPFKVKERAKVIIKSQKPKPKKKEVKIPTPPSLKELYKRQMEKDLLDCTPILPGDEEPDFNPSEESSWLKLMTVAEIKTLAHDIESQRQRNASVAKEFLTEEPILKTAEFDFVVKRFGPARRCEPYVGQRGRSARV